MGDALPQGRSDDGTALRFMLRRGAWVARFPGERSLALGTPGLHDERPVGLWAIEGTDTNGTHLRPSVVDYCEGKPTGFSRL